MELVNTTKNVYIHTMLKAFVLFLAILLSNVQKRWVWVLFSFLCMLILDDTFSGLLIIWRWRIFVHISRSLCCCYALSLQWSLVKVCSHYFCKFNTVSLSFSFELDDSWFPIYVCRYVEVNMDSAALVWPLFNSLQAFWPGLQVLIFMSNVKLTW